MKGKNKSKLRMSNPSRGVVSCSGLKRMITMLVLLIMRAEILRADWSVTFENPNPCAVKGSSVQFRCSYNYDDGQTVKETTWYKGVLKNSSWVRVKLSDLPSYENRSEYVGDKQSDCGLALHDLLLNDTGYYYFRFDTKKYGWRSKKSVYLSVTELRARVYPDTVRTGDEVTLECETSCQLHNTVWYKDGRQVAKPSFQAQAEDSGEYVCAAKGQESLRSDPVALDVYYPPINVSVEVSYPSIPAEDSRMTLTCSSFAHPADVNYTWFMRTVSPNSSSLLQVGSGQVLTVELSHIGLYLCQARNIVGENNSTEVLLTLSAEEHGVLTLSPLVRNILIIGGKVVILLVLSLVIIWAWRKGNKSAIEEEENNCDYENISTAAMDDKDRGTQLEMSVQGHSHGCGTSHRTV